MKTYLALITAAFVLSGCVSQGNQTTQLADNSQNADDLVCKFERPTGSNIGKKVCRTRDELEKIKKINERSMDDLSFKKKF